MAYFVVGWSLPVCIKHQLQNMDVVNKIPTIRAESVCPKLSLHNLRCSIHSHYNVSSISTMDLLIVRKIRIGKFHRRYDIPADDTPHDLH